MKKNRKYRKNDAFYRIIRGELICLAVASVIVFGAVRLSERNDRQAGSENAQTVAPTPTSGGAEGILELTPTPAPEATKEPETLTPDAEREEDTMTPTPDPEITGQSESPTLTPTPVPGQQGMDTEFIQGLAQAQSGELLMEEGAVDTVYYLQTDPRWGNEYYGGEDTIAKYACGPTSMAIVVSSLTTIKIDPLQMSGWAYDNGYWYPESGSLHTIVNDTARAFGLTSEGVGNDAATPGLVLEALKQGDMAVVLMGKGHFTKGGHFIVLRGVTDEGKILVADCNSEENTQTEWDMETLTAEAKYAADGGPFWIIRNPNTID